MTRNYILFVEDILEAIESIENFIGEMDARSTGVGGRDQPQYKTTDR